MRDSTRALLENWSRWSWEGAYPQPLPPNHAGSAEGNHIPEGAYEADDRVDQEAARREPANGPYGMRVELIYHNRLTQKERWVMLAEFPRRFQSGRAVSVGYAAQRLRISAGEYERLLESAAAQVESQWERGWLDEALRRGRRIVETVPGKDLCAA